MHQNYHNKKFGKASNKVNIALKFNQIINFKDDRKIWILGLKKDYFYTSVLRFGCVFDLLSSTWSKSAVEKQVKITDQKCYE